MKTWTEGVPGRKRALTEEDMPDFSSLSTLDHLAQVFCCRHLKLLLLRFGRAVAQPGVLRLLGQLDLYRAQLSCVERRRLPATEHVLPGMLVS